MSEMDSVPKEVALPTVNKTTVVNRLVVGLDRIRQWREDERFWGSLDIHPDIKGGIRSNFAQAARMIKKGDALGADFELKDVGRGLGLAQNSTQSELSFTPETGQQLRGYLARQFQTNYPEGLAGIFKNLSLLSQGGYESSLAHTEEHLAVMIKLAENLGVNLTYQKSAGPDQIQQIADETIAAHLTTGLRNQIQNIGKTVARGAVSSEDVYMENLKAWLARMRKAGMKVAAEEEHEMTGLEVAEAGIIPVKQMVLEAIQSNLASGMAATLADLPDIIRKYPKAHFFSFLGTEAIYAHYVQLFGMDDVDLKAYHQQLGDVLKQELPGAAQRLESDHLKNLLAGDLSRVGEREFDIDMMANLATTYGFDFDADATRQRVDSQYTAENCNLAVRAFKLKIQKMVRSGEFNKAQLNASMDLSRFKDKIRQVGVQGVNFTELEVYLQEVGIPEPIQLR